MDSEESSCQNMHMHEDSVRESDNCDDDIRAEIPHIHKTGAIYPQG
jgi:hypothetical protein